MRKIDATKFQSVLIEGGPGSGRRPGGGAGNLKPGYTKKYLGLEAKASKKAAGYAIAANKGYAGAQSGLQKWNARLAKIRSLRPPNVSTNPRWRVKAPRAIPKGGKNPTLILSGGRHLYTGKGPGTHGQKKGGLDWGPGKY